jgi:ribosome modulation factor
MLAKDLGRRDFHAGIRCNQNPFNPYTHPQNRSLWEEGWLEAAAEYALSNPEVLEEVRGRLRGN